MGEFQFPKNPGTQRENPFRDESGQNPFADEAPAAAPVDENPFTTSLRNDRRPYQPGEYETFLPHRAGTVFRIGVTGVGIGVVGVLLAGVSIVGSGSWTVGLFYCVPVQLLGLAISLPAWIMGAHDLKAMRAGAMDATGQKRTRQGTSLGIVGALAGAVPVFVLLGLLVVAALNI